MESSFGDTEALHTALARASALLGVPEKMDWLLERIPEAHAAELNQTLVALLEAPDLDEALDVYTYPPELHGERAPLLVRRAVKDGRTVQCRFFRFREAMVSASWSLVGLSIGLWMTSPTAAITTASLAMTAWRNLLTLRRPDDADAIDAYEAFLKSRLAMVRRGAALPYPSTAEIAAATTALDRRALAGGLSRLRHLKILEVKVWGGAAEDNGDAANLWAEIF